MAVIYTAHKPPGLAAASLAAAPPPRTDCESRGPELSADIEQAGREEA